jgi:hypothetical protein
MNAPEACWLERFVFTREKDVLPAVMLARNDGAEEGGADRHGAHHGRAQRVRQATQPKLKQFRGGFSNN